MIELSTINFDRSKFKQEEIFLFRYVTQTKDVSADPEVGKEVSIELAMPRASVQLVVRVTSGANQEPLKDATLTLRCQNPASATVGDQGTNSIGDHRISTSRYTCESQFKMCLASSNWSIIP